MSGGSLARAEAALAEGVEVDFTEGHGTVREGADFIHEILRGPADGPADRAVFFGQDDLTGGLTGDLTPQHGPAQGMIGDPANCYPEGVPVKAGEGEVVDTRRPIRRGNGRKGLIEAEFA